jgi:hypothetical protein
VNLAGALGVVAWRDQRLASQGSELSEVRSSQPLQELWCWSVDLDTFWDDEDDPRWRLLVSIAQSLGLSAEQLFPCDQVEDKPTESAGIAFGESITSMVCLPTLNELIMQPQLKKRVWQSLCQHFLNHA